MTLDLLGAAMFGASQQANAHGYVETPASRSYQCNLQLNSQCGSVQYEPQSVEGLKGFPQSGPPDGHIASANISTFSELDQQTPTRWSKINLKTGPNSFTWKLTAQHRITSWRYVITKPDWDASQPLSRASFELTPFCQYDDAGAIPAKQVTHQCTIPADRLGSHVILAVWDIADTTNAFYQMIDVKLSHYTKWVEKSARFGIALNPFSI
jgi:chitin-binding protein